MLVRKYYTKDIRDYEDDNRTSILKLCRTLSLSGLIDLVRLGNNMISEEEAGELVDDYIAEYGIKAAYDEIKDCLFGRQVKEDGEPNGDSLELDKYETLTDIYNMFYQQLKCMGTSYGDFWRMTTKDVYREFEGAEQYNINKINMEMMIAHAQASMNGAAVWGKLEKEPPRLKTQEQVERDNVVVYNGRTMSKDDAMMYLSMELAAHRAKRQAEKEARLRG